MALLEEGNSLLMFFVGSAPDSGDAVR